MSHDLHCDSCGMPIESGRYCAYCTDADGNLQAFDERFERMVGWQARHNPSAPRKQLEAETLAHMATLPAWKDHPRVVGRSV
ncbi:zinc ribbon domain-containing protein [Cellulomonas sp. P5_C6]